jgi:hypothetical protein
MVSLYLQGELGLYLKGCFLSGIACDIGKVLAGTLKVVATSGLTA